MNNVTLHNGEFPASGWVGLGLPSNTQDSNLEHNFVYQAGYPTLVEQVMNNKYAPMPSIVLHAPGLDHMIAAAILYSVNERRFADPTDLIDMVNLLTHGIHHGDYKPMQEAIMYLSFFQMGETLTETVKSIADVLTVIDNPEPYSGLLAKTVKMLKRGMGCHYEYTIPVLETEKPNVGVEGFIECPVIIVKRKNRTEVKRLSSQTPISFSILPKNTLLGSTDSVIFKDYRAAVEFVKEQYNVAIIVRQAMTDC